MIYGVHFTTLIPSRTFPTYMGQHFREFFGKTFNLREMMARRILQSEEDVFVFITTNHTNNNQPSMHDQFLKWADQYKLTDLIVFTKEKVTNPQHRENLGALNLIVLASKEHFWREMFEENLEIENGN